MTTTYLPLLTDGPDEPGGCPEHGAGPRHGSRARMTCRYRCGNACDKPLPNRSDNPEFTTIAERAIARRTVLGGAAVGAGVLVVGGAASPAAAAPALARAADRTGMGRVRFAPVAPNTEDKVTVPPGFRSDVLISWGDPIIAGAPAFDVDAQTPAKAKKQFGYNNDFCAVMPLRRSTALMFNNHEYTNEELMFPTGDYDEETQKRIAMASHGLSVVKLRRGSRPGSWKVAPIDNPYNRRFHTGTPFRVDGPAAGTRRMRTSADPEGRTVLGTLNNCSGGVTPWGTVLSGEENIDQYFEASSGTLPARYAASYERYGFQAEPERGWGSVDERFDLSKEPHEAFRFGWIVEVDPYDPGSTPRKHTMLGRFKHEGANVVISKAGHAVAYMGDDEKGEYLYKFVSAGRYTPGRTRRAKRRNMELLTRGTLYVGHLTDGREDPAPEYDGDGTWLPLCSDTESYVDGMSVADVLIDTRLAADTKRATRMDRPEDVDVNPVTGRVYACLTNNDLRGTEEMPADEPNPIDESQTRETLDGPLVTSSGNRNGYVLEMEARGGDHDSRDFVWRLMLVCGDPEAPETYFAGFDPDKVSPISCPDNVAFDEVGNLWVSTDGNKLGSNDGLFRVPSQGPRRGQVRQFLTVPPGAETCGPVITWDQQTVFVSVQHPGEDDAATFETPVSTWPTGEFPRPSVVTVRQS